MPANPDFLRTLANSGNPKSMTILLREILLAVKSLEVAVREQTEALKPRPRGRPRKNAAP